MRRIIVIAAALLVVALLIAWPAVGDDGTSGTYRVRAVFDNAGFAVPGEEVRIAGAAVGTVESVDLSTPEEQVSLEPGHEKEAGKAVLVLKITDSAFTDFRTDASCIVRPQSLIGEKYVECDPTQPRAPGTEPPPEIEPIPDGQAGAGEYLVPLENNGRTVDLDLIQNISRKPYADRFRLIVNDLGAGLAARGKDLSDIIRRADPALRQTDRVLAILAAQNKQLASLASDSDAILAPLAAQRAHITGFLHNANTSGQATLERAPQLEASLQKFPAALHEVRLTMNQLGALATQGVPLFTDLNASAKDISKATQKLEPFAKAGTPALTTLGTAAQAAGPKLVGADPVIVDLTKFTQEATPVSKDLYKLLYTFGQTKGFEYLWNFVRNSVGSINGFDSYGHFLRANLQITGCLEYQTVPFSGCESFFRGGPAEPTGSAASASSTKSNSDASGGVGAPGTSGGADARSGRLLDFLLGGNK